MYVCMYVCMYVYMYVYMYVCVYDYASTFAFIYVNICISDKTIKFWKIRDQSKLLVAELDAEGHSTVIRRRAQSTVFYFSCFILTFQYYF
jgi:hypothetical protein